jgi:hypothetical protein
MTLHNQRRCDAPINALLYMELHWMQESAPSGSARSRRSSCVQNLQVQAGETLLDAYRQIDEPDGVSFLILFSVVFCVCVV